MQDSKGSKVSFIFNVPNIPFRERTKLFPIFLALLFFYRVQTGVPNFINPSNGIPRIFRDVGARKQQPSLRDKKKLLWYTEYSLLEKQSVFFHPSLDTLFDSPFLSALIALFRGSSRSIFLILFDTLFFGGEIIFEIDWKISNTLTRFKFGRERRKDDIFDWFRSIDR